MLAAYLAGAGHPAVAALLGLGAAGLAGAIVAMAWSVHARQIRLAEQLARRQFIVTAAAAETPGHPVNGDGRGRPAESARPGTAGPVIIEGPDTVVAGQQARYSVRLSGGQQVMAWAAGGGAVSQAPDPSHPDELLLTADQPGSLIVSARVRDGMTERRGTKPVTAVADVTAVSPPFPLRLFLQGWGLIALAVLIIGFAGALDALGDLVSSDFIALASLRAALLGVITRARGSGDAQAAATAMALAQRGQALGTTQLNGAPDYSHQPSGGTAKQPHPN